MNINWFSPVPPARTDIAHYTARVLPALQGVAKVRVYTTASEWELRDTEVASLGSCDWKYLNAAANIYNIGNNSEFHAESWEMSRKHAGIVILHDVVLQDLFAMYFLSHLKSPDQYLHIMQQTYGAAGLTGASCFLKGACTASQMTRDFPLTGAAIRDVLGAVVHTKSAFNIVCDLTSAPVRYLPLPYPASPRAVVDRWTRLRNARSGGPHRLVVFGFLGLNRRIDAILEALATMKERREFVLDVYGIISNPEHLQSRLTTLGLNELVHLHGYVEDLDDKLACADLAFNLRYPTMGEASGAQLRIWDHGLPTVVTQTGWYGELPPDVVCHVRPETEIEDLQSHLRAFLTHTNRFVEMGRRGRDILIRDHSPEAYARGILQMVRDAEQFSSSAMFLRVADRAGGELRRWLPRDCTPCLGRSIDETALLAIPRLGAIEGV